MGNEKINDLKYYALEFTEEWGLIFDKILKVINTPLCLIELSLSTHPSLIDSQTVIMTSKNAVFRIKKLKHWTKFKYISSLDE